ncbi:hypothetical protein BdWA1_000452 [Babesia duncani]|uniref:Uncharacterized protein n=1 Tax=Babesia duncani TaxID=323732 RepID=A0AAD9PMC9_9APIC|nr:hypothetical protein BdWA1_000452 [Babesia duncani]
MEEDEILQNSIETVKDENKPLFILRVYNVPSHYTVVDMEKLINDRMPNSNIERIILPFPWQERTDCPWKIICGDENTYNKFLSMEHIYLSNDKASRFQPAITFMEGDPLDMAELPTKADESLLLNEYLDKR